MSFHQKGPLADKKVGISNPLEVYEKEKQRETGSPKGFRILTEGASLPEIQFEHQEVTGGSIGSINAISEAKVYPKPLQDTFGEEENLHDQFVDERTIMADERKR